MITRFRRLGLVRGDQFGDGAGGDTFGSEMRGEKSLHLLIDSGLWLDPGKIADIQATAFGEWCLPM